MSRLYFGLSVTWLLVVFVRDTWQQEEDSALGCPAPSSESARLVCQLSGQRIPCQDAAPSTVAKFVWRGRSTGNTGDKNGGVSELVCGSSGEWERSPQAGNGYTKIVGMGSYKVFAKSRRPWPRAENVCVREGGHLVVFDTQEEYAAVIPLIEKAMDVNAALPPGESALGLHVGVHDRVVENVFETVFHVNFVRPDFWKWKDGESSGNANDSDCMTLQVPSYTFKPFPCQTDWPFICEKLPKE